MKGAAKQFSHFTALPGRLWGSGIRLLGLWAKTIFWFSARQQHSSCTPERTWVLLSLLLSVFFWSPRLELCSSSSRRYIFWFQKNHFGSKRYISWKWELLSTIILLMSTSCSINLALSIQAAVYRFLYFCFFASWVHSKSTCCSPLIFESPRIPRQPRALSLVELVNCYSSLF